MARGYSRGLWSQPDKAICRALLHVRRKGRRPSVYLAPRSFGCACGLAPLRMTEVFDGANAYDPQRPQRPQPATPCALTPGLHPTSAAAATDAALAARLHPRVASVVPAHLRPLHPRATALHPGHPRRKIRPAFLAHGQRQDARRVPGHHRLARARHEPSAGKHLRPLHLAAAFADLRHPEKPHPAPCAGWVWTTQIRVGLRTGDTPARDRAAIRRRPPPPAPHHPRKPRHPALPTGLPSRRWRRAGS